MSEVYRRSNVHVMEHTLLVTPTKIFASGGANGDPIAPPSTCVYLSLKLNSTAHVASFMSSTKTASEIQGGSTLV